MKQYIGTKVIQAEFVPGYEKELGDGLKEGRIEGYNIVYPDGYQSWSPKEVFEEAYRESEYLTFGLAVEMAKRGQKVKRQAWCESEFIVYQKGYPEGISCNKQTADAWGMNGGDLFKCAPYLQYQSPKGMHYMYNPSNEDILAEDWRIVE